MTRTPTIVASLLAASLATVVDADTTLVATPLPGGSSAAGAYTMASVYGQSTTLDSAASGPILFEPGFLCIEQDDLPILGDLNGDGLVNGIDLAVVLGTWGPCGSGSCIADINRDGVVNGADLSIVLGNWG